MKILVVIDMQNDFTSGVLGNKECEEVVPKIVDIINKEDYDEIYLTRDTHTDNYLKTQEGKKLPVKHCIKGTEGWQIRKEIMDAVKDKLFYIIDKPAFGSLKLAEDIKTAYEAKQKNLEIILVGVCTGICVISNAMILKAALPEAVITVKKDACACVTPESHKTALDAMKMCHINID